MKKLIYILFVLITIAFAVVAIAGFATGRMNPEGKEWISFPGLVLLPVLAVNLCLFLMWCVFRSHWCWVPLAALLLNWEFLISMFQIRVFPKEIPIGKEAVKVITYNVNNFNTDGKKQLPNIADRLRKEDPDIVSLQECPVESALRMDSVAKTLSFLPYYCSTRSATKAAGNAIFSKYPILRFESILYPESSNKSLFAVMDIQGDSVRVFNNHFQTTSVNAVKPRLYQAHAEGKQLEETEAAFHMAFQMKKNFVKRATQADYIRQMLDAGEGPVILCGDFNDTPASYTYRTVKGDLTDGFRDCGSGFGYTFRQLKRIFRIDYIIYSPDFKGVTYDSPNLDYSDHKPVVWLGYVN